jgi:hypothetical protein
MTTYFVSSVDGNNADSGLDWANAKQTVAGALAVPAASGDVILVDSAHNFVATAAITWTAPAGAIAIISVNRAGGDAWLAGAKESVGAAAALFAIVGAAGSAMFIYGMTINGGTSNNTLCDIGLLSTQTTISKLEMRNCTLDVQSASANTQIVLGTLPNISQRRPSIRLMNSTFICSGSRAGGLFTLQSAEVEIINPTFSMTGATKPASLFTGNASDNTHLSIRDGDVSGYAVSGGAYFDVTGFVAAEVICENLKTSSTPTLMSGTWPGGVGSITLRNVDSGDTIYVFQYVNSYGTLTADTSIFITSGGAAFNGAGVSWKIVTSSLATEYAPFVTPMLAIWNTATGAQTSAIEIIRDSATALTNRDIWSNIDFAASASFPNYTYQTNRNANPFTGTPANQTTSTATWTGAGGFTNTTKQKLENAFTAAEVGLLMAQISVGVASTTFYLDPYIGGVTSAAAARTVWGRLGAYQQTTGGGGGGGGAVFGAQGGVIS